MIQEVLERALETVESMEREEYFSKMLRVLEKYVLPQEGEMFFSEKDLSELPADFNEEWSGSRQKKAVSSQCPKKAARSRMVLSWPMAGLKKIVHYRQCLMQERMSCLIRFNTFYFRRA